jgi:hypothetical protein
VRHHAQVIVTCMGREEEEKGEEEEEEEEVREGEEAHSFGL